MTQPLLPLWVQIIQALGPTIIALVALFITGYFARLQWSTARDKLRLDLFDKRYSYFVTLRDFMIHIIQNGTANDGHWQKFWQGMIGVEFVFNREITSYIENIASRAQLLRAKNMRLQDLEVGEKRNALVDEVSKIFMSISDEFPLLEKKFANSMNLGSM